MTEEQGPISDLYVEKLQQKVGGRSLRRLGALLGDSIRLVWQASHPDVIFITILSVGVSLIAAAQVLVARYALTEILDANRSGGAVSRALPAFAVLALLSGISGAGGAAQGQRQVLLSELVTRASWGRLLDVTTRVPLETYDSPSFFDHLQRVQANALSQPVVVVNGLLGIAGGLVGSIGLVAALLVVQPLLVPVLLLAAGPLFLLQRRGGRIEFAFALAQTTPTRRRYALAELLMGRNEAKEVRAFGVAPELRRRHDVLYDGYVEALRIKVRRRLRLSLVASVISAVVGTAAVGLLLLLVQRNEVSLGSAGATVAAIGLLGAKLEQLASGAGKVLESGLYLADLQAFMEQAGGVDAPTPVPDTAQAGPGFDELAVRGVSYRYPGTDRWALRDVDLTLRRGEVIALVGENGSGKTTLSKLLAHLYEPTEGSISWDGVDVRQLDPAVLRSATAVLFQDFVHYELTLRDNIGLGRVARSDDQAGLEASATAAGMEPVLERLGDGWDTFLSRRFPGGTELSGGQWQRVAMARAFFRDAPFVVLDEPTAALDPRAEASLFEQLRSLLAGRTVVLVSHRFSSVRHADRIAVLEQGRLVELGTHTELMGLEGRYAEMFRLQADAFLGQPAAAAPPGMAGVSWPARAPRSQPG